MNIFVIPSCYKNKYNKQANIFVHEQCMSLINRGHKVTVLDAGECSYKRWLCSFCSKPTVRFEDDVKIYSHWVRAVAQSRFPKFATSSFMTKIDSLWNMAVENEGMPDVIYAHFTFPSGFSSITLSKKYNVPLVVMEHGGMYLNRRLHPYIIEELTATVNEADEFYCVSNTHSEKIKELTSAKRRVDVVPNMISSRFSFCPVKKDRDEFVFFSAGNLKHVKRFDLLIRAFAKSFPNNDKVVLRIAGEGVERENLEKIINELRVNDKVKLLGRLGREEMLDEFHNCNVFTLASDHESFGIVYREAAACGRPLVSTRNGGIEHEWRDEFGILVPCDDTDALSVALKQIYENYTDYSPELISKLTLDYCSEKVVMDRIESILSHTAGEMNV